MKLAGHKMGRGQAIVYWGIAIAFVAWQIRLHLTAGYTLPTPWPDEAHFLYQAAAFADGLTLFAQQINTERIILWMPPGYMVLQGLIFMITGLSLDVARTTSLLLVLASFGMLVAILRSYRPTSFCLLLAGLCFVTGPVVATGNVARPEALLLAIAIGGTWLIMARHPFRGLAVLCIGPLVHPNGAYFLIAGALALAFSMMVLRQRWRPSRQDLAWFTVTGVFWLAYALLALMNWDSFSQDMAYQFGRKSGRELLAPLMSAENIALLLAVMLAGIYALKHNLRAGQLLILGLPAWFAFELGHEMWYHVYRQIGLLLIFVFLVQVFDHLLSTVHATDSRFPRRFALAVAMTLIFILAYQKQTIPTKDSNPANLTWEEFKTADSIPYLAPEDMAAVGHLLDSLDTGDEPLTVQIRPHADAFLIPDLADGQYQIIAPIFSSAKPDIYIIHRSRYLPRSVYHEAEQRDLLASGHKVFDARFRFHQRQSWERWYCFRGRNQEASTLPSVHR